MYNDSYCIFLNITIVSIDRVNGEDIKKFDILQNKPISLRSIYDSSCMSKEI